MTRLQPWEKKKQKSAETKTALGLFSSMGWLFVSGGVLSRVTAAVFAPLFLASLDFQPKMNLPYALTHFYPLPEETLLRAYSTGNALLVEGKFQEALREFNRAVELAPNSPDVHIARGIVYEKLFDWSDAIKDYQLANQLLKPFPFSRDDATAISNIANAETGLGRWEEALRDFSRASKLQPGFLAPKIGRALVQYQLGQASEAEAFFEDLLDDYPSFPDGLAAYAVMSFRSDSPLNSDVNLQAQLKWQSALEIDGRYSDVEWVRDIRRWPPKLVDKLNLFLTSKSRHK